MIFIFIFLFLFCLFFFQGGGTENTMYYGCMLNSVPLMETKDLAESWNGLVELLEDMAVDYNWFSRLEKTEWLTVRNGCLV
jgi:hypothetical protein